MPDITITTVKTAQRSLLGDVLTLEMLKVLVADCNDAHVPGSATVTLQPVAGGFNASAVWTAAVQS